MRKTSYAIVGAALMALAATPAMAQSNSAKTGAGMTNTVLVADTTGSEYGPLLPVTLHVPNDKELIIDVTLECGLKTRTKAKRKGGKEDSAVAEASVRVFVRVDSVETDGSGEPVYSVLAEPAQGVIFCKRTQTLTAEFQGLIEGCIDAEGHIFLDDACLEPETVELILDTMSANAFNFVAKDLPQGDYTTTVWAEIDTCTGDRIDADNDGWPECDPNALADADALATIGLGAAVADLVRFVND